MALTHQTYSRYNSWKNGCLERVTAGGVGGQSAVDTEALLCCRLGWQLFQDKVPTAWTNLYAGDLFQEQLSKRNTYLLYAVTAAVQGAQGVSPAGTSQRCPPTRAAQPSHCQADQAPTTWPTTAQPSAGRVMGYVVVQVNSLTAHVNKLAVAPEARRQGVATRLLQAVLQQVLAERRVHCATLHVDASNGPALALYRKAGFVKDGTIEDYYGHGRPAWKLLVDLQESEAMQAFLAT